MPIIIYFCQTCATTVYKEGGSEKFKDYYVVHAGTLDAEDAGKKLGLEVEVPDEEYWVKFRAGWVGECKGTKQWNEFAP